MPAVSRNQAIVARIAEHNPGALYKRNRGMLKMKPGALHEYAATRLKGLARKVKSRST